MTTEEQLYECKPHTELRRALLVLAYNTLAKLDGIEEMREVRHAYTYDTIPSNVTEAWDNFTRECGLAAFFYED